MPFISPSSYNEKHKAHFYLKELLVLPISKLTSEKMISLNFFYLGKGDWEDSTGKYMYVEHILWVPFKEYWNTQGELLLRVKCFLIQSHTSQKTKGSLNLLLLLLLYLISWYVGTWSHCICSDGSQLIIPSSSASRLLELQVWVTMPSWNVSSKWYSTSMLD